MKYTPNLNLFEYDPKDTYDANSQFLIQTALNDNWDKIDAFAATGGSLRKLSDTEISDSIITPSALVYDGEYWINKTLTTTDVIKTFYTLGTSGYIILTNGWCMQWGQTPYASINHQTIEFSKEFADSSYFVITGENCPSSTDKDGVDTCTLTSNFNPKNFRMSCVKSRTIFWVACGYLKVGEY